MHFVNRDMGQDGKSGQMMLSILRIVVGFVFIAHGMQKHFNWPVAMPVPMTPWSQVWIGGWLELIGGLLILVGLCTRPVAFVLSGMMAVAYFQVHALPNLSERAGQPGMPAMPAQPLHTLFFPLTNGGELAVLYCFVFLYFVAVGGGPLSLDARLKKA